MYFTLLDENVSVSMNVLIIIANIINLIYNIPQMIQTYKTKSTRDFSALFLALRIVGNTIWVAYSIEINSFLMLLNNLVTVIASVFIGYYKAREMYADYYKPKTTNKVLTTYV
jgi:MtN3 and saliva related transmembrane protein